MTRKMMQEINENGFGRKFYNLSILLLLIAVITLIIVFTFYFWNFHDHFSNDSNDWGNMGDFIGGILSPIFSLFSVVLVIFTIIFSIKNMNDNRKEQNTDRLYTLVFKIDDEINSHIKNMPVEIPSYDGPKNPRPTNEYKTLQLANMYNLFFHWLNRLVLIDKNDAVAIHITEKHGAQVRELQDKKWFTAVGDRENKIVNFFNMQSARLFRDD